MSLHFKDYLHFSKSERKGIIGLILLIVIVIVIKSSLHHFYTYEEPVESEKYKSLMAKIDSIESASGRNTEKQNDVGVRQKSSVNYFAFDPNKITAEDWQSFGLSEKQAAVIMNYKSKGGTFRSKNDVKKMFVISDSLFEKLNPYIQLPETLTYQKQSAFKKNYPDKKISERKFKKHTYPKVYLNTADTATFKKLYGIGEVLAQRIVEYRESLGGFHSKDQLSEIWGLRIEVLTKLDTQLIFNKVALRKLNINAATKKEFKAHPYIYWKQANAIVNYRKQHGKFKKMEDLKKVILVPDSLYDKIEPYLEL